MSKNKFVWLLALLLVLPSVMLSNAFAQRDRDDRPAARSNGQGWAQALSDLRYARANLDINSYPDVTPQTQKAVREIDDAMNTIRQAAVNDHGNVNEHPPVDTQRKPHERFQDAIAALDRAHSDVASEEDNAGLRGLRRRTLDDIDAARINARQAFEKAQDDFQRKHAR